MSFHDLPTIATSGRAYPGSAIIYPVTNGVPRRSQQVIARAQSSFDGQVMILPLFDCFYDLYSPPEVTRPNSNPSLNQCQNDPQALEAYTTTILPASRQ